jgi:hypothetical protein
MKLVCGKEMSLADQIAQLILTRSSFPNYGPAVVSICGTS